MSIIERHRYRRAMKRLGWLADLTQHPTRDEMTRVRRHAGLVPLGEGDGAILVWMFDTKPGASQFLIVRLSEREANAVYDADPYAVGLLEPVRRRMKNEWSILAVQNGQSIWSLPYRIPKWASEDKFIEALDHAAATCPAFLLAERRAMNPTVQAFTQGLARDLALA